MPGRVLIVDDHPTFRSSVRRLLEAEGYEVIGESEDGESAIDAVRELRPDIVLLDVQLPGIDGFEVARRLTERTNGSAPAVVLVSSRESSDYGESVAESGASGFISKAELSGEAIAAVIG